MVMLPVELWEGLGRAASGHTAGFGVIINVPLWQIEQSNKIEQLP